MEIYLKHKGNLYYKIKNIDEGVEIITLDTKKQSIRYNKCFPTAYKEEIYIISKEEYEEVKNKLNL